MDLQQLRYLVALAEERSFTRAAEREHIAQPALSQQIRRLEDEVGLALAERTTRSVSITPAGELLVARARRILAELAAARSELEGLRGVLTGRLTIGAIPTMGPVDISLPLAIFHERHPLVELTVREGMSQELGELLRADLLDLAFLSVTGRIELESHRIHGLGVQQLLIEELVVTLPRVHRLAHRRELRLAELADETFVSFREGARLREILFEAARRAGFEPKVMLESSESQPIRALVHRGMGVAILPRSDAVGPGPDVAVAKLTDPPLMRDITLAWREGRRHSPAAAEFLGLVLDTFLERGRIRDAQADGPRECPDGDLSQRSGRSGQDSVPSGRLHRDPAPRSARSDRSSG